MARRFRIRRKTTPGAPPATGNRIPRGGGSSVVDHAMHDHAVHVIPWVVLVLFAVAGTLLHMFIQLSWSRAGMITLILLATGGLTYSVWMTQRERSGTARWHGVTTTSLGGLWLALCTATGFTTLDGPVSHLYLNPHGFTVALWAVAGGALVVVWNTRITARRHGAELAAALAAMEPEVTPMEIAGHKGARLIWRSIDQWKRTGTLVLAPGDTLERFQKDINSVETAHGFAPNSMTVTQRRDVTNSCVCDVTVMLGNPISEPQPWPGLLAGAK